MNSAKGIWPRPAMRLLISASAELSTGRHPLERLRGYLRQIPPQPSRPLRRQRQKVDEPGLRAGTLRLPDRPFRSQPEPWMEFLNSAESPHSLQVARLVGPFGLSIIQWWAQSLSIRCSSITGNSSQRAKPMEDAQLRRAIISHLSARTPGPWGRRTSAWVVAVCCSPTAPSPARSSRVCGPSRISI